MQYVRTQIYGLVHSIRRVLIRILLPATKLAGKIHFSPKERAIKSHNVNYLYNELELGDVVLSYTSGELTNLLIEGEYKHCGIYAGSSKIIEATSKGVTITELDDFCASKDKVGVFRSRFCSEKQKIAAVRYARDRRGSSYDYYFEPNEHAFYCAELIAKAYDYATAGNSPFTRRDIWGVETVLPIDFKLATSKFETVVEVP